MGHAATAEHPRYWAQAHLPFGADCCVCAEFVQPQDAYVTVCHSWRRDTEVWCRRCWATLLVAAKEGLVSS